MAKRDVDQFFLQYPEPQLQTLLKVRDLIMEIVPDAEQCIYYGIPTFKVDGVPVAAIAGAKNHCSYYPHSGFILDKIPEVVAKYEMTKGALHFAIDKPLPKTLLRKLIKARQKLG
jgi:uncharacterized protein YdhG (YjbR/CyaY superfamily)